ncbi:CGNR zinc finger domain-containing protein [Actinomadura madurae]|uniref:CGNR zinc finger domain-containing protein n=1 Tax=Actinomadura madurae TaxID=1993 RepID=UPI0020265551|nr:CGNR zinc finger domain-containing protein [Actinomadura madurae]MCP9965399.1 CGNR zinc finger domain-containing protein [Actinomadura madurae]MCQ0010612.1 CGNR zinc finger domain-containing protein [Actinomadura madurae]URN04976.1 CGNR zinc finger domain-containing protein [Actinomadura madurae]
MASAVKLVNGLTEGERRGRPYTLPTGEGLVAVGMQVLQDIGRHAGLTADEAAELAAVARELRVVFEAVAAGDVDAAAGQLNRLLARTRARPRLERHDGEPWHLHFHGEGGAVTADWGASCAAGLAVVLGGETHDRLGVCTAPHCDRVYVDTSRNGTRRFCGTACQNRVKAAAFRARAHSS